MNSAKVMGPRWAIRSLISDSRGHGGNYNGTASLAGLRFESPAKTKRRREPVPALFFFWLVRLV